MSLYGDTLTKNIKGAFQNSLEVGDYKLTDDQEKVIDTLAKDLSDGIVKFLQDQTFRITEMKAICELETMNTSGPYKADVLSQVKVVPGQKTFSGQVDTVVNGGMTGAPGPVSGAVGKGTAKGQTTTKGDLQGIQKGILIPKVNFRKTGGGQGGTMKTKGYAYIGDNPVGSSGPKKTQVKLTEVKNK